MSFRQYQSICTVGHNHYAAEGDDDSPDPNPYRYNRQYYDAESGYIYLRARYYDPAIGRFVSEDPALDGHNWYIYGGNNPIMYHDPSGMFPLPFPLIFFAAIAVLFVATLALAQDAAEGGPVSQGFADATARVIENTVVLANREADRLKAVLTSAGTRNIEERMKREHTVYILVDRNAEEGKQIRYVGRTKDVAATEARHGRNTNRSGLKLVPVHTNLNYFEARLLEQTGMLTLHNFQTADAACNRIHGMSSTKNANLVIFAEFGKGLYRYAENQVTNELDNLKNHFNITN